MLLLTENHKGQVWPRDKCVTCNNETECTGSIQGLKNVTTCKHPDPSVLVSSGLCPHEKTQTIFWRKITCSISVRARVSELATLSVAGERKMWSVFVKIKLPRQIRLCSHSRN